MSRVLTLLVLLASSWGFAQQSTYPDAPAPQPGPKSIKPQLRVFPAPTKPSRIDKSFWALTAAETAAATADMATTIHALDHGRVETNILYGSHPSTTRIVVQGYASEALLAWGVHWAKSGDNGVRKWWCIPQLLFMGLHTYGAAHNASQ